MPKSKVECSKSEQSSSCTARTINLAHGDNSLEERRTKMLVYEKKHPRTVISGARLPVGITSPKCATRIRVCTAADMKQTCPPVMCSCPAIEPRIKLGLVDKMVKAGSFGLRAAIVGAVVWWTWDVGVWSDAKTTERLYVSMKDMALGRTLADDQLPDGAPKFDRVYHSSKEMWNKLVTKSFHLMTVVSNKIDSLTSPNSECSPETGSNKTQSE